MPISPLRLEFIHSQDHVPIYSHSLNHFYPSTLPLPSWHSSDVHVRHPADHLCQLRFAVFSTDKLSETEIERWRAGGAVCHENPGLCNLRACPCPAVGVRSIVSHCTKSQLHSHLGSSLEKMLTVPCLCTHTNIVLSCQCRNSLTHLANLVTVPSCF